jgi:hypothetical protein
MKYHSLELINSEGASFKEFLHLFSNLRSIGNSALSKVINKLLIARS